MPQKEHTYTPFDDDLASIRMHILEMCRLIETQFNQSLIALLESDATIARQVIELDYSVNQLEVHIDSLCVTALARQQPAASDLRSIVVSTKIVVHLERIGDEAKKIARIAERLAQQRKVPRQRLSGVQRAAEIAQKKLIEVLDSYTRLDTTIANTLLCADDSINEEFNDIFRKLIKSMTDYPRTISSSLDILFVAKSIEVIGNHVKHIAQLVIEASSRYSEY